MYGICTSGVTFRSTPAGCHKQMQLPQPVPAVSLHAPTAWIAEARVRIKSNIVLPLASAVAACDTLALASTHDVVEQTASLLEDLRHRFMAGEDLRDTVVSTLTALLLSPLHVCMVLILLGRHLMLRSRYRPPATAALTAAAGTCCPSVLPAHALPAMLALRCKCCSSHFTALPLRPRCVGPSFGD